MNSTTNLSINDFSSLIELLTGLAIAFAGLVTIIHALSERFSRMISNLVNDIHENHSAVLRLFSTFGLSPRNQNFRIAFEGRRRYYTLFRLKNNHAWYGKVREKIFNRLVSNSLIIVSYTATYGIFVLIFIGFNRPDLRFTYKNLSIPFDSAIYKILFLYTLFSFFRIFYLCVLIIFPKSPSSTGIFKSSSSDIPALFSKNITASAVFIVISIYLLLLYYSNNSLILFVESFKQPIFVFIKVNSTWFIKTVSVIGALLIIISGYPLLYIFTFVFYKISLTITRYRIFRSADIIRLRLGPQSQLSWRFLFDDFKNYFPVFVKTLKRRVLLFWYTYVINNKFYFFIKAVLKLHKYHLLTTLFIIGIGFLIAKTFFENTPFSGRDATEIVTNANTDLFNAYLSLDSLSVDSIQTSLEKSFIHNGSAQLNFLKIIKERKKEGYYLERRLSFFEIKKIEIVQIDLNHEIILKTHEVWHLEWVNKKPKKERIYYNGDDDNPQTYILTKENDKWKIDANYYKGENKFQLDDG